MTELVEQFQHQLENIIGKKRIRVRLIHDDRDICINSNEREILYAIQEQQREEHDRFWFFSERFLTKALIIPINSLPVPKFEKFPEFYKKYFVKRIQGIIEKYDANLIPALLPCEFQDSSGVSKMVIENKQTIDYEKTKSKYKSLLTENTVDFVKYKQLREKFESIRNL